MFSPSIEEFKREFCAETTKLAIHKIGKKSYREEPIAKAISQFSIGGSVLQLQHVEIDTLRLYETANEWQPRHDEHRGFIGGIIAQIPARCIIPLTLYKVEISWPVFIPRRTEIVVAEIGKVNELFGIAIGIEAATKTNV